MLTPDIKKAYERGFQKTLGINQVEGFAKGLDEDSSNSESPRIFKTSIENFMKNHELSKKNFGTSSVLVESTSKEAILEAAKNLRGHLTATIFGTPNDLTI